LIYSPLRFAMSGGLWFQPPAPLLYMFMFVMRKHSKCQFGHLRE